MIENFKHDIRIQMNNCIQILLKQLNTIRCSRINPSILDSIYIKHLNKKFKLNQLSNIIVEDFNTLKINLFDNSIKNSVIKEISNSKLDLNPLLGYDGVIRIAIPTLTEERRLNFVKTVKHMAENSRICIRNIRKQFNVKLKLLLRKKEISKDREYSINDNIQSLTNEYINKINSIINQKEKELMN